MPSIDTENLNKILDYWFKQNGKEHKKDRSAKIELCW